MPKHAIAGGAVVALCAGPALAELTAEGVWADWQRIYGAMGSTLTAATEEYGDGRLVLTGIRTSTSLGGARSDTTYGTLALVEQADGSVAIDIPARMAMETTTTIEGRTQTQTITMETEGFAGVIREVGAARVYDIDAARLAYVFSDASGEVPVTATVTLTGADTEYTSVEQGDTVTFDQAVAARDMSLVVTAEGPEPFEMTYRLDDLASDAAGTIDLTAAPASGSLSEMGLLFSGEATHAGSTVAVSVDSGSGPFYLNGTSEAGRIGFDLSEDALGYTLSSTGAETQLRMSGFPLPVDISLEELTTGVALPAGASDEPKPFAMTLALRDLTLDEALWGLFDPTGQLPRDAATILLDLSGTALMRADIFGDPEAMAALGGPPGELRTLDLTQLQVSLAGAELAGDGALEFPNPGPIPQPVGSINLSLDGGLGLVDRLVALGFVPPEQAAFVKGMAGMVAEQVGEDQLRSVIEFTEGGGISANGMPLR